LELAPTTAKLGDEKKVRTVASVVMVWPGWKDLLVVVGNGLRVRDARRVDVAGEMAEEVRRGRMAERSRGLGDRFMQAIVNCECECEVLTNGSSLGLLSRTGK
jgi:hypothetical protein